jgi:hypothetical protein
MSYGVDLADMYRRVAGMTGQVLGGRKSQRHSVLPADQIRTRAQSQSSNIIRA